MAGSFYVMGYHPHWLWKVINWHLWGLEPPADSNLWAAWEDRFGKQVRRAFSRLIQFDWDNIQQALTHAITRFKGLVHDSAILELLKRYQYGGEYYKQLATDTEQIGPAEQRKDLYVIATNMTNGRETIFHYQQHRMAQNNEILQPLTAGRKTEQREIGERLIAQGGGPRRQLCRL